MLGYVRTLIGERGEISQIAALKRAGCTKIHVEAVSSESSGSPVLDHLMNFMEAGDTLVVARLNRISNVQITQLDIIDKINKKGCHFISLRERINTNTIPGKIKLNGFKLAIENSSHDKLGSEELLSKSPSDSISNLYDSIETSNTLRKKKIMKSRHEKYMADLIKREDDWLPYVKKFRPILSWNKIVDAVNSSNPIFGKWTRRQLERAVRAYVGTGKLPEQLLGPIRQESVDYRILGLISLLKEQNPSITLQEICLELEKMGEPEAECRNKFYLEYISLLIKNAKAIN